MMATIPYERPCVRHDYFSVPQASFCNCNDLVHATCASLLVVCRKSV
jgi:hypothetical protein